MLRDVYIIDAKRTPQVKAGFDFKDTAAPYLAAPLVRYLIDGTSIGDDEVDEVIFGNTAGPAKYPNIARVVALEAGLDKKTSAHTVQRNCASGLEAVAQGYLKVASGRSDVVVVGGVENMSQIPFLYSKEMTDIFINLMKAKSLPKKLSALVDFRPPFLVPVVAIEQGLTDPFCGLNMGLTAEKLAREFGISRESQDEFANASHRKAVAAEREGRFRDEILPVVVGKKRDRVLEADVGPRADSTMASLGKLRPYFEKKSGTVTVGNSCPITDGASALLLASEQAVKRHDLCVCARIVDYCFRGLEPERMGLGPLVATHGLLKRTAMSLEDMDLVEINEAFAAQVIAVKMAFADKALSCRWGVGETMGAIDEEKFNVNGGAIALGHPVGSTGARLIVTLMHELVRRKGRYGLASLCIGGGQGGACLIENVR